jgi:hypothetical protein
MTCLDTIVAGTDKVEQGFHPEHHNHHSRSGGSLPRRHWQNPNTSNNHDISRTPLTHHSTNKGHQEPLIETTMGRP